MIKNIITVLAASVLLSGIGAMLAYPTITGSSAIAIKGNSMEPTIPFGALAYAESRPSYGIGDIITYQSGSEIVTHRIVSDWTGNGDQWRTQGDNNEASDQTPVANKAIIGKVTYYVPYLGIASQMLSQPPVIGLIVVIILIVLFWPLIWGSDPVPQAKRV